MDQDQALFTLDVKRELPPSHQQTHLAFSAFGIYTVTMAL